MQLKKADRWTQRVPDWMLVINKKKYGHREYPTEC